MGSLPSDMMYFHSGLSDDDVASCSKSLDDEMKSMSAKEPPRTIIKPTGLLTTLLGRGN